MLRRLSAVLGILLLAAILIALVVTVQEHRSRSADQLPEAEVHARPSSFVVDRPEGEVPC
ncbi:MAG TPA: hypothetical protein VM557_14820 [Thermoanaerobaculia bacterium]|nr:hypothetical protein [Thermoanaerobaculia bacterium]